MSLFLGRLLILIKWSSRINAIAGRKHNAMTCGLKLLEQLIHQFQGWPELLLGYNDINKALLPWLEKALINHTSLLKNFVSARNNRMDTRA